MQQAEFDFARMQHAAESGFMNAWAAATYLVDRGVPSRLAHEAIGKAVQICVERGCERQDLPLAELQPIHAAFDQDVYKSLTLDAVLSIHNVVGGTGRTAVQQSIQHAEQRIAMLRGEIHAHA